MQTCMQYANNDKWGDQPVLPCPCPREFPSIIVAAGMPYPQNLETAQQVEAVVSQLGTKSLPTIHSSPGTPDSAQRCGGRPPNVPPAVLSYPVHLAVPYSGLHLPSPPEITGCSPSPESGRLLGRLGRCRCALMARCQRRLLCSRGCLTSASPSSSCRS